MRNCALQLKYPLLLAINMVKAARLRPEDHINSESVLCCEEAIFESLPLDLLLDQLLEALFVIHWDFYNLHFNEQQWWRCCGGRYHWRPLTTDCPMFGQIRQSQKLKSETKNAKFFMEGIFLRKCKFAKSLLVQAIGGQGWIDCWYIYFRISMETFEHRNIYLRWRWQQLVRYIL